MAFETEHGNVLTQAAVNAEVGAAIAEASLAGQTIEIFPLGESKTHTFQLEGSLVAEEVAESVDYSYSANSEYSETNFSVSAKKIVLGTKLTVEMLRFGPNRINKQFMLQKTGKAFAKFMDDEVKTLFSSLSQGVTAPSTMEPDVILEASYEVTSGIKDIWSGKLVSWIDHAQELALKKWLVATGAAAFSNAQLLELIFGVANAKTGYCGSMLGVDFYRTSGLPTDTGKTVAALWDPMECFGLLLDERGVDSTEHAPHATNGLSQEVLAWLFNEPFEKRDLGGCRMLTTL